MAWDTDENRGSDVNAVILGQRKMCFAHHAGTPIARQEIPAIDADVTILLQGWFSNKCIPLND
jgi:hypothetical protein